MEMILKKQNSIVWSNLHEKGTSIDVFPACKNQLNFSFQGQFKINILIVRHI